MRGKDLRVAYCQSASGRDYSQQKRWDRNLSEYASVRRQGIQPDSTKGPDVRRALEASQRAGEAYGVSA
jgi:hypothetical protein